MKRYWSPFALVCAALAVIAVAGCDSGADTGGSDMDAFANQMEQSKVAAQAKAEADARAEEERKAKAAEEDARRQEAEQARLAAEQAAAQQQQPASQPLSVTITVNNPDALFNNPAARAEAERLTAGGATVGQGGSYYDAIIGANRSIRTRTDDLAWTQAVQHFWAQNGRYPKSHEEFMRDVIEAGEIPLPELEDGQEYFYAPPGSELAEGQFGTLYILEPKRNPPAPQPSQGEPAQPAAPPATESAPQ
jgi:hypothetical protein